MAGFGALDFGVLSSAQKTHMRTSARRVRAPSSIVIFAYLLALMLWCEVRGIERGHRASDAEWALRRDNRVRNVTTDTCLTAATSKTCLTHIHINCGPGVLLGLCSKCLAKSEVIKQARNQYHNCCGRQECGQDRQAAGQLGLARHPQGPWDIGLKLQAKRPCRAHDDEWAGCLSIKVGSSLNAPHPQTIQSSHLVPT